MTIIISGGGGSGGVTSIAGNTGAFTLGRGLTNSTNVILVDPSYLQGYLGGLQLSNDGVAPNTKIDVSAGVCVDDTNAIFCKFAAGAIDCSTTGANALDTGTLGASTWYHAFAIMKTDGTTAFLASTSVSSPTFPSGYTLKRRIGSFKTDASSHILAFTQTGDTFSWAAPVVEGGGVVTVGITRVTQTLTGVPTGVVVNAICYGLIADNGVSNAFWLGPVSATDAAPSTTVSPHFFIDTVASTVMNWGMVSIPTNTSAQIAMRASAASNSVRLSSQGWIDTRGRFA